MKFVLNSNLKVKFHSIDNMTIVKNSLSMSYLTTDTLKGVPCKSAI